jgi:hypothetical protein
MQAAATANFTFVLDTLATHVAYIISEATKQVGKGSRPVIEPAQAALDDWARELMQRAVHFAGMRGCTPSYLNSEGEMDRITDPEQQMKMAKNIIWGDGFISYYHLLHDWQSTGKMEGLEVTSVQ